MKRLVILTIAVLMVLAVVTDGYCAIKYVGPYVRSDGTWVNGGFRETSCDGNPYNNANFLGLND